MREPFPKEWFGDAWKAIVGYLGVRCCMYLAYQKKDFTLRPDVTQANTYSYPVRHQIALVDNQDNLLVCLFLLQVLQYRLAHGSKWITGIQDMQDDV